MDNLYAFFIQWSPDIYGDEEVEREASKRGFVVIDDDGKEQLPDGTSSLGAGYILSLHFTSCIYDVTIVKFTLCIYSISINLYFFQKIQRTLMSH